MNVAVTMYLLTYRLNQLIKTKKYCNFSTVITFIL